MKHEGRGVIRIGDKTDHGGQVISASSGTRVMGRFAALANDETFCPACKGKFPIRPDGAGAKHMGRSYAYDMDKTACGARLISSLDFPDSVSDEAQFADAGSAERTEPTNRDEGFDRYFVLSDASSGQPLANRRYTILMSDGSRLHGRSDESGRTETCARKGAEEIELTVFDEVAPIFPDWDRYYERSS